MVKMYFVAKHKRTLVKILMLNCIHYKKVAGIFEAPEMIKPL